MILIEIPLKYIRSCNFNCNFSYTWEPQKGYIKHDVVNEHLFKLDGPVMWLHDVVVITIALLH